MSQYDTLSRTADMVGQRLGRARIGVVLGSGLSEALENLHGARALDYAEIPGLSDPSTEGHRGALLHGSIRDVPVLALCGRIHMYEERANEDVAAGIRLLSMLGVHTLVVTSAVGSIDPETIPGHMVLVEDHINVSGRNVLAGPHDPRFGPRFPDVSQAYDPDLMSAVEETAAVVGVRVRRGLLVQFLGPTYETPAEVRLAGQMGGSVVSMSMVPDVVVARQRGMRVIGLGCVTNLAAGVSDTPLGHEDVLRSSALNAANLQTLLAGLIPRLDEETTRPLARRS